jgi:hypothetical protein
MAMAVQQMHPIAHLPLVLGVLRRLEVATILDRLIPPPPRRMGSRVGVGSQRWSSRFWRALMLSRRWGNGRKNVAWWRCCSRGSRGPRSMLIGSAIASRHGLRPLLTRCRAPSPSKRWRCIPSCPPGCIRPPRPWRSLGRMRMPRRPRGHRGQPTGIAKPGGPSSHRCSSRMVKKLMRRRACSISGALRAIRDTESGLCTPCLG